VNKVRLRVVLVELVALSLLASALAVPALAEEEYQVVATLQSPEPEDNAGFSHSVAVSGDIVVVGEAFARVEGFNYAGKVYIFESDGNLKVTLQSPTPQREALFGDSVAVRGDIVLVGEPFLTVDGKKYAGRAYIFDSNGNLQATLQSPPGLDQPRFGRSAALSEEKIVVGGRGADVEGVYEAGKVYVYDPDGNLLATLQSLEPITQAKFSYSVACSRGIIIVGEPNSPVEDKIGAGNAFIFDSEGNLLKTLQAPEPQEYGSFGFSVAVSGDLVVVGEYNAEADGYGKAGKAYIFDLDGNLLAALQSQEPDENALFGSSVAISGYLIIVGEPRADGEVMNEGRAYIFDTDGGLVGTLQAPIPGVGAEFGSTMAASEDILVIGEPGADVEGKGKAGRVYIFQAGAAAFTSSGLNIEPSSVDVGGTVTISVEVTNTGAKSGTHTVALMIDGEVEDETTVTLNPDESETVSFQVSAAEQGSYSVEVDGLTGSYTSYTVTETPENPSFGDRIPGFPYEAIIIGLMTGIFIIWLLQRRH
jgi:hypothetical protein